MSQKQKNGRRKRRRPLLIEEAARVMLREAGQAERWLGYRDVGSLEELVGLVKELALKVMMGTERGSHFLLGLMRSAEPWELLRRQPAAWWDGVEFCVPVAATAADADIWLYRKDGQWRVLVRGEEEACGSGSGVEQ